MACPHPALAGGADAVQACILLSRRLPPYLEVADGVGLGLKELRNISSVRIFLDDSAPEKREELWTAIQQKNCDLIVAIGPEAAHFAWWREGPPQVPKIFAMVRDPVEILGAAAAGCGISLDIPVSKQLRAIRQAYPDTRRIGLLFDPTQNLVLLKDAAGTAEELGMTLLPLAVSAGHHLQEALNRSWDRMEALWILPDRKMLSSKRLAEYVIRQSFYRKVPVIGYNQLFYDSGASLAFVIDYREVGAQCARKAVRALEGAPCEGASPAFELWVNTRVMTRMGVPVPQNIAPPLRLGP